MWNLIRQLISANILNFWRVHQCLYLPYVKYLLLYVILYYYYYFSGTMQEVLISIAIFLTTSNKTTNGLNPKQKQSKSGFPKYSLFCQETFMVVLLSHLILLITLRTPSSARSYPPLGKQNTYVFKKYILAVF